MGGITVMGSIRCNVRRRFREIVLGCWLLALPGAVAAAVGPEAVYAVLVDEIAVLRQAQQAEERWAEEKTDLRADYEALRDERARLEKQTAALGVEIDGRRCRLEEVERKMTESARVKAELQELLQTIVNRLEVFIQNDLPFSNEERASRIAEIKKLLAQSDVDLSEKCRRAMEALQVETQYGHNLEVTEETIALNDGTVTVDVLRVGRLALFFQSPDSQTVGWYDRSKAAWQTLPTRYQSAIHQACEMAMRRRPVDLVKLPIGRIEAP